MSEHAFGEKLYTSTEVAEILGVSLRSIYRYLDENKIQAAVKTATGRHRFTKQNVNDFLHPSESVKPHPVSVELPDEVPAQTLEDRDEVSEPIKSEPASQPEPMKNKIEEKPTPINEPIEESVKDEPVDWLARFRQAAEKYKTESETTTELNTQKEEKVESKVKETEIKPEPEPEPEPEVDETTFTYYRSGVGGLKEIAQSLDKAAKNASLDYAFTMSAGLSLHKPIKPFSLIHSYVNLQDVPYFEKVLQLTPSQKDVAQLCLITSSEPNIYKSRKEMHGLYVVSDQQIKLDLLNDGETELANEIE